MPGLNVVALISGGKDSLFSILHCQAQGHNVVALGNLYPPQTEQQARVDDMESYMYQTIGHAVIPLYEQALALPLYRQEIIGSAVNQRKSYGLDSEALQAEPDETESLVPLLRKVVAAHPEVNAVSTGAILSDYQRTRVESVALRLGLTPLSYLWQWPTLPPHTQTSLLEDMSAVGQDARIIKVASGGLDESFLWRNVANQRVISRLSRAAARFGTVGDGAVLGEGGEFETLAVDGPVPLWKGRIVVEQADMADVAGDAGSASLIITKATVEMKTKDVPADVQVREPALLDASFTKMLVEIGPKHVKENLAQRLLTTEGTDAAAVVSGGQSTVDDSMDMPEGALVISHVLGRGETAAEQTHSIMESLALKLAEHGHHFSNVVYTTIVLRDMTQFAMVNGVYGSYFTYPNPPARLTVACADVLPENAHLSMGFTSFVAQAEGLHVQSRSYWAPANIGPYSQAIKVPINSRGSLTNAPVFIAGQIPLVPASMELVVSPSGTDEANFLYENVLALQHLVRIGSVMKVQRWVFAIAFIATSRFKEAPTKQELAIIQQAWNHLHTDEKNELSELSDSAGEEFDVWDLQNRPRSTVWHTQNYAEALSSRHTGDDRAPPPLRIISVDSLPRGSAIEWAGFGQTHENAVAIQPIHLDYISDLFRQQTCVFDA